MITDYIAQINQAIEASLNKYNCSIYGLSEPIMTGEEDNFFPAIIDEDGECRNVFTDDDYNFGCYHRLLSKTYQTLPGKGFGDNPKIVQTAELNMICWAFNADAQKLEQHIFSALPNSVEIVSTDFDKVRVFRGEIKGFNFHIAPNVALFSIKYKVRYQVKKTCTEITDIFHKY